MQANRRHIETQVNMRFDEKKAKTRKRIKWQIFVKWGIGKREANGK